MADQPETVFSNDAPEQTPVTETPTQEVKPEVTSQPDTAHADLLKSIVRDDGTQKYASVEDAITALKASQEFIETLKTENATYKAEVEKRATAEEVLAEIKATNEEEVTPSPEIDLSQIDALVDSKISDTLTAVEAQKLATDNVQSVIKAMTSKFGDKAEEQYIAAAEASGFTVDQLNDLSATNPKAVLKLAGLEDVSQGTPAPSTGSINTEALQPVQSKPSAKLPQGATGKDYAAAWRAAGESIN